LLQALRLSWVPRCLDHLGPISRHGTPNIGIIADWPLPLCAHEYVQRNVRFSPLPENQVHELADAMGPQMVLFASDYPHPEGAADAVERFHTMLDDKLTPTRLADFFGGNAQALLEGRVAR